MPIYFGPIAPYCPVSRDSPLSPESPWAPSIRTAIPRLTDDRDLAAAIRVTNIARSIITQIVRATTVNNVHTPPPWPPRRPPAPGKDKTINKLKHSRWTEDKAQRIKRKYKYFAKNRKGEKDEDNWVMTERIEKMVWNDKGWKTSLIWLYGEKGEGELQDGGGNASGGEGAPSLDPPPTEPT
jgi:hypothetical protein